MTTLPHTVRSSMFVMIADGSPVCIVGHPSMAVDLLPALDALQMRLQALERENGVSRRRVQELEYELEIGRAHV